MKRIVLTLGVVLGVFATGSHLHAQYYYPIIPQAPDACWGGYYQPNEYGQWYGPSYCVYPPFAPFQGMLPAPPRPAVAPGMVAYQPGMPPQPGMPGYQPGMPGYQPGMPGYQPGMLPQPGMPGYQPGMLPQPGMPGYQPGLPPRPGLVAVPGGQPTMQMPPAPYGYGYGPAPGSSGIVAFPSHQWARSPRDFFMVD